MGTSRSSGPATAFPENCRAAAHVVIASGGASEDRGSRWRDAAERAQTTLPATFFAEAKARRISAALQMGTQRALSPEPECGERTPERATTVTLTQDDRTFGRVALGPLQELCSTGQDVTGSRERLCSTVLGGLGARGRFWRGPPRERPDSRFRRLTHFSGWSSAVADAAKGISALSVTIPTPGRGRSDSRHDMPIGERLSAELSAGETVDRDRIYRGRRRFLSECESRSMSHVRTSRPGRHDNSDLSRIEPPHRGCAAIMREGAIRDDLVQVRTGYPRASHGRGQSTISVRP